MARAGTTKWLQDLYKRLNKEFFGNELPKRLRIEWVNEDKPGNRVARVLWHEEPDGTYKPVVMQFSRLLKPPVLQKKVGLSMLHEMVHLMLGAEVQCEDWDGAFDKAMFSLAKRGAFRLFW